jgi:hypothetical protein
VEAIKDPLTHVVHNAVDHGLESPEARIAAGKNPEGTLTLRAYHEGGHINIEIADDGGGINVEKVKARAIQRGLVRLEGDHIASGIERIGSAAFHRLRGALLPLVYLREELDLDGPAVDQSAAAVNIVEPSDASSANSRVHALRPSAAQSATKPSSRSRRTSSPESRASSSTTKMR